MTKRVQTSLAQLRQRLQEVIDLRLAGAVLDWDQNTYMPDGGAAARGRQLAILGRLAHERFVDPAIGRLLDVLQSYGDSLPPEHDDAALLRVTRRDYERATRVPSSFAAEAAEHNTASYMAWAAARPANDFAAVQPFLEKTLDLSRRYADFFPGYAHPADPLIADVDYGMTAQSVSALFADLRQRLTPLVDQICSQPAPNDAFLFQYYPEEGQWAFGLQVAASFGYDFKRGRQDRTLHPFMTKFSLGDVRITTRVYDHDVSNALFGTMHETGHALYEQGIDMRFESTPLAEGTSAGVHESQSRLWENLVGRSRGFWESAYPKLQRVFPGQLGHVSMDAFYRAVNKVKRSLIRVDADEVTYNLHVIVRFELGLELLSGQLAVKDLPDAWRERYQNTLGIHSNDDKDGVLQDVHWYADLIGGSFQGYTLGNILSAQFFDAAVRAHPEIPAQIAAGEFATLHSWLVENIYQHGSKFTTAELVERVTGGSFSTEPYFAYLAAKYGELYRL